MSEEKLIFNMLENMLENINTNIGEIKTHGDELKTSFEELKNESIKYHTIVDGLRANDKELNRKLEKIIRNGSKIETIEKRVDGLANIAKYGFIAGVATTFIMGVTIFFAKTTNFISRVIN